MLADVSGIDSFFRKSGSYVSGLQDGKHHPERHISTSTSIQKNRGSHCMNEKRTAKNANIRVFRGSRTPRTGIEPAAFRLGGEPSILLRYRGIFNFEMKKAALQRMV